MKPFDGCPVCLGHGVEPDEPGEAVGCEDCEFARREDEKRKKRNAAENARQKKRAGEAAARVAEERAALLAPVRVAAALELLALCAFHSFPDERRTKSMDEARKRLGDWPAVDASRTRPADNPGLGDALELEARRRERQGHR